MFNLMDKEIIAILRKLFFLNWPYVLARILLLAEIGAQLQGVSSLQFSPTQY